MYSEKKSEEAAACVMADGTKNRESINKRLTQRRYARCIEDLLKRGCSGEWQ